jgi:hypothetical protein
MADENTDQKQQDQSQDQKADQKQQDTSKDQMFDLTVNGERRSVTLEEMKTLAQKASGAESKFQEANELRKQAEDGIRMKGLIDRLSDGSHTPTDSEIKELSGMLGLDPEEFSAFLKEETAPVDDPQDKGTGKIDKQALIEALGFDPAEAKSILEYAHQGHIRDAKNEIRKISDEAVDKDPVFGKMIIGENGKDRSSSIKEMVAEDVLRRIQDGQPFGTNLVAASVQKMRAHLTKFGVPGRPDQYPVALGLGPGMGLPAEVQSETPIKRVSAAEDGDESNFVSRVMQKGLQMLRSKPRE